MKNYLLFDLDGTLTDPKIGITTCVQYALQSFGIEEPDLDKLEPFIGPPLKDSFMEYYQMDDAKAEAAIAKYRERFQDIGIFENQLYHGISHMLRSLKARGMHLAVASSKPQVFVERILEHFHIAQYFEVVVGSELDGSRVKKSEVVEEALHRLFGSQPIQCDKVYMIGDTRFDVEGAHAFCIECVGVSYGYGGLEELKNAKCDYIVQSVEELGDFLLREVRPKDSAKTPASKIWKIGYPLLLFLIARNVALFVMSAMMTHMVQSLPDEYKSVWVVMDEAGQIVGYTGNVSVIISALSYVIATAIIYGRAKKLIAATKQDMILTHLKSIPVSSYVLLGVGVLGSVLGMNLLLDLTGMIDKSASYQAIASDQHSASLWVGLICYGVITALCEELLFRGTLYGYLRHYCKIMPAILLSAFLFGTYHLNTVQGIYGFVMGCLMAYGYEYFGTFLIPVIIHMVANVIAYTLSYTPIATMGLFSWPLCIVCLLAALGSFFVLYQRKRL